MSDLEAARKLRKWPFYLADLVLSGIAAWVIYRSGPDASAAHVLIILGCLLAGAWAAWLSVSPWLIEFRANTQSAESATLSKSLAQIKDLERVADLIRQANSQWQGVQDAAGRTVSAAREISDKMKVESDEFMKFIQNAHNDERAGLRLEAEKLRRTEGDWIKVVVQILDHVFAITRAAERSGQQSLITQLTQFQNACRDAARRIGLSPFVPAAAEPFDPRAHQLPDAKFAPPENAKIGEVLATGFTYQGQLLRRALVLLENPAEAIPPDEEAQAIAPPENPEPLEPPAEPVEPNPQPSQSDETNGSVETGSAESPEAMVAPEEMSSSPKKTAKAARSSQRAPAEPGHQQLPLLG
jgi:molecular chaperone GrpE (heat shock protein)